MRFYIATIDTNDTNVASRQIVFREKGQKHAVARATRLAAKASVDAVGGASLALVREFTNVRPNKNASGGRTVQL